MSDLAAVDRAWALLAAHRPEQALAELATLPPGPALGTRAAHCRAAALAHLERWPEAGMAAHAGITANGLDPDLLRLFGLAEEELGRPHVAERAFLDGLALVPNDVSLLCAYAQLCAAHGQADKAGRLVARAAALEPVAAEVFRARARVAFARGDDRAAQRISHEYLAEYPDDPVAHALTGTAHAVRGRYGPAYDNLRQAVAAEPTQQTYAEAALELRVARHPLLLPIRPIMRFGALKTWVVVVGLIFGLGLAGLGTLSSALAIAWIVVCVYSWVAPPLVSRWVKRHWA